MSQERTVAVPETAEQALSYAQRAGFSSVKELAAAWVERDKMLKEMVDALDQVKEALG